MVLPSDEQIIQFINSYSKLFSIWVSDEVDAGHFVELLKSCGYWPKVDLKSE